MERRSCLGVLLVMSLSCSSRTEAIGAHGDARDRLRAIGAFGARIDEGRTLVATETGFQSASSVGRWANWGSLQVTLPRTASGAVRLSIAGMDGAWLSIAAEDPPIAGAISAATLVFPQVAPDLDVVHVIGVRDYEELRLLRSVTAKSDARYRIQHGAHVARLRLMGDHVEAVDAAGSVVFKTEPPFAVDARGTERRLRLALSREGGDDVLTTSLDMNGLVAPIAIDPSWSAGPVPTTPASVARYQHAFLASGTTTAYFIGGTSNGTDTLATAVAYESGAWKALPDLPQPRREAALGIFPIVSGGVLMIVGGRNASGMLPSAEVLPYGATAWTPAQRVGGSSITTDLRMRAMTGVSRSTGLMLVGGNNGSSTLSSVELIEHDGAQGVVKFKTNPLASLATPRESAAVLDADAVVAGGRNGSAVLSTAERWTGSAWVSVPAMSKPRVDAAALGQIVVGGFDGVNSLSTSETLSAGAGAWTAGPVLSVPRRGAMVFLLSNAAQTAGLFGVAGGTNGGAPLASVDGFAFDSPTSWVFRDLGPMPSARAFGNAFVTSGVAAGSLEVLLAAGTADGTNGSATTALFTPLVKAAACIGHAECASGYCVDGVCCESACTGQCETCNAGAAAGFCTPVTGAPKAGRAACDGVGAGTVCGKRCDGQNRTACVYPLSGSVPCNSNACTGGEETKQSFCNGSGLCADTPKPCSPYVCGATSCKISCAANTDCAGGYRCKSGFCVAFDDPGSPCVNGETCKSGFCADNVCCDKPCAGQCESCGEIGKQGTCSVVGGVPRGTRTACDASTADVCKAKICDGTNGAMCAGFANGTTKVCADAKCESGNVVAESKCDGSGTCAAPSATSCAPYVCEGKACRASCTTSAHCATGNECVNGQCIPASAASCDASKLISIAKDGTKQECKPYRCKTDGNCDDKCSTSSDCQDGFVCETSAGKCIAQSAPVADEGGGCVMGRGRARGIPKGDVAVLALVALVGLRRRRRILERK